MLLLWVVLLAVSCKEKSKIIVIDEASENQVAQTQKTHPGKKLLAGECYICHNPNASEESMIAPPMIAIKKHYIVANTSKEVFTESLIQWVNDPETVSKMPVAHKKFGAMPYIPYPDEAIALIADYLYDNEIEKPGWFDAHYEEKHSKGTEQPIPKEDMRSGATQKSYDDIGMEYAMAAKTALGKNLIKALKENGPVGALAFCNANALALTDSISLMKNAIINRVSDKPRNPKNAANEEESGYIYYFKKLVEAGKEPKPIVKTENGAVNVYYPITTNAMCLQCHGKPNQQITSETLEIVKNLYPLDKAVGYDVNEVRGIWAINFDEVE